MTLTLGKLFLPGLAARVGLLPLAVATGEGLAPAAAGGLEGGGEAAFVVAAAVAAASFLRCASTAAAATRSASLTFDASAALASSA